MSDPQQPASPPPHVPPHQPPYQPPAQFGPPQPPSAPPSPFAQQPPQQAPQPQYAVQPQYAAPSQYLPQPQQPTPQQSPFVPGGTVFRPTAESTARFWRLNLGFGAIYVLLFGALAFLQRSSGMWMFYVTAMVVLVALTVTLTSLAVRRTRIEFRDGAYVIVQSLLPTRTFTVAEVQRVVTVGQMSVGAVDRLAHQMILGVGRRWAWLTTMLWTREQLTALALDLQARGAELLPVPGPTTPADLRRWDVRTQTWFEVNRILVGVLAGVGAIVLVIVIAVVVAVVLSGNG